MIKKSTEETLNIIDSHSYIVIMGVTESGETFRPSDWAERICGALSTFNKNRIDYSPLLTPSVQNGHKCILLDPTLQNSNPSLYTHVLDFAAENNLKICKPE
jgi:hypothetical protein